MPFSHRALLLAVVMITALGLGTPRTYSEANAEVPREKEEEEDDDGRGEEDREEEEEAEVEVDIEASGVDPVVEVVDVESLRGGEIGGDGLEGDIAIAPSPPLADLDVQQQRQHRAHKKCEQDAR